MTMEQLWPETTNIKISPDYNFDWSQLPYKISAQNISSKNADNVIINTFNISHEDSAEGMLEGFVKFLNSDSSNLKSYIKNLLRERPAIVQENAQRIKNLNK